MNESPENYLNPNLEAVKAPDIISLLQPLLAEYQARSTTEQLENTSEGEMTDSEYSSRLEELNSHLPDEETAKENDQKVMEVLRAEISKLHQGDSRTLSRLLAADQAEVKELLDRVKVVLPSGVGEPSLQEPSFQQATEKLREYILTIARENGWEVEFIDSPTRNMEQYCRVKKGSTIIYIGPSLFSFDTSPFGSHGDAELGNSHLRKYAQLQREDLSDASPEGDNLSVVFSLESGIPEVHEMPTQEEMRTFEQVVAAYY